MSSGRMEWILILFASKGWERWHMKRARIPIRQRNRMKRDWKYLIKRRRERRTDQTEVNFQFVSKQAKRFRTQDTQSHLHVCVHSSPMSKVKCPDWMGKPIEKSPNSIFVPNANTHTHTREMWEKWEEARQKSPQTQDQWLALVNNIIYFEIDLLD